MMQVQKFTFNAFQENSYVLFDETKEAIIIDPGCYDKSEQIELSDFIEHEDLTVVRLINTHCHVDHVLGNSFVKHKYNVGLEIHEIEEQVLQTVKTIGPVYGFPMYQPAESDSYLVEGTTLSFGSSELKILFVPGHAPGHIAFYNEKEGVCIAGDVLFRESIGRTDLPGGSFDTLIQSIHSQLFTLPDDVIIYAGHGPETTIGHEKQYNPFCGLPI